MEEYEFTKEEFDYIELDYINEDVFDSTNNIYAFAKYDNMPKFLSNRYTIECIGLPIGTYTLKGKYIDLHFKTKYKLAHVDNRFMDIRYTESDVFSFIVRKRCNSIMLQVKKCKDIENIVKELRRQAILNKHKLEQKDNLSL